MNINFILKEKKTDPEPIFDIKIQNEIIGEILHHKDVAGSPYHAAIKIPALKGTDLRIIQGFGNTPEMAVTNALQDALSACATATQVIQELCSHIELPSPQPVTEGGAA